MIRALSLALLFAMPVLAAEGSKAEDEAGDVSEVDKDRTGPLRDRVTPVSGHLFLMKGRFELSPEVAISFRDPFYSKYAPGLMLSFHFTETLGVQLRGAYAISVVSGAAQICTNDPNGQRGCRAPTQLDLDTAGQEGGTYPYGRMGFTLDLNLEWAPIYGKLGTLAVLPFLDMLHFNIYVAVGPAFILPVGVLNDVNGKAGPFPLGGNASIGFRFFTPLRFLTVRAELRDVIYYESYANPDNKSVRNQLFLDLGISLFLPTDFTRE